VVDNQADSPIHHEMICVRPGGPLGNSVNITRLHPRQKMNVRTLVHGNQQTTFSFYAMGQPIIHQARGHRSEIVFIVSTVAGNGVLVLSLRITEQTGTENKEKRINLETKQKKTIYAIVLIYL
jgi:hypothetical protein